MQAVHVLQERIETKRWQHICHRHLEEVSQLSFSSFVPSLAAADQAAPGIPRLHMLLELTAGTNQYLGDKKQIYKNIKPV